MGKGKGRGEGGVCKPSFLLFAMLGPLVRVVPPHTVVTSLQVDLSLVMHAGDGERKMEATEAEVGGN